MASDVAEFLKKNFLESVMSEKVFSLPPTISSLLNDIKDEFMEINKEFWSPPPPNSFVLFHHLDNALAEFRDFCKQETDNKRSLKITIFSGSERDMEKINGIYKALISMRIQQQNEPSKVDTIIDSSSNSFIRSSIYHKGFDEEILKKIHKCLDSEKEFKAIGIHGMCGIGKTTLVKKIVADEPVQAKYMKPIIWVHLSDLTPEEMDIRIVKEILLCLNDDPDLLTEELEDDALVERLRDRLKGRRYLIVLDGVWHCNEWFSNLHVDEKIERTNKCSFSMALPKDSGGAVIVTSRVKELAKQLVGEKCLFCVKPWSDENMKQVVKQCLERKRSSGKIINDEERLINEVVNHCHGLPLVAETLSAWIAEQITGKSS
ncbi:probable disease resistance protein At5g45490 [Lotus japonicus]|uniref:probable disease resistance protein At5g45490 n=1 Tax=Lotus japonicus TaxID=34305 RepID=UPI00258C3652|nr:probable disease resistance protein At5g45490 [Lotus japonicus]